MRSRFTVLTTALLFAAMPEAFAQLCGEDLAIAMSQERTGHVSVSIRVYGEEVRMLVDTGANVSTLDKSWAAKRAIKLASTEGRAAGEGRAKLPVEAVGRSLGAHEFAVMDLHFINIPSQRYGTDPYAGQLGAAFFSQLKARLNFDSNVLCVSLSEPR